jgi:mRNA interferase MazF
VICEAWDVVTIPFPFTDSGAQKRRPALVLSQRTFNRHGYSVMAMITSAQQRWPSDSSITNLGACGLSKPCVVRLKLFTLDNRLIVRRIGRLADSDKDCVAGALKAVVTL